MAENEGLKWASKKSLQTSVAKTRWNSEDIILARPEVFMNLSGEAVSRLAAAHIPLDISRDLLIVLDDIALPFGRLRLRGKGTDGGHNGLKSIHTSLGTTAYPRLRMGIAPEKSSPAAVDLTAFVLESFGREEKKAMGPVLEKACQACHLWATESLASAMNVVNP